MQRSAQFALQTLGGFSLNRGGMHCDPVYEKGRALLAYLAMESGRPQSRPELAGLFWPGHEHHSALNNLRQVLLALRRVFDAAESGFESTSPLIIERESVRIDLTRDISVDALQFAKAPECLDQPFPAHCILCQSRMESLFALYQGEFMAGFSLPDCPEFEDWLQVQREAMHLLALTLMTRLSDCHEKSGAYQRALPVAQRFIELEPWNDEGVRRVMRLYALSGQRANALARYENFSHVVKRDLGTYPAEETRILAENIRQGDYSPYVAVRVEDATQKNNAPVLVTERRQVTVLYGELSAPDIDDPDEALALLREPQERCAGLIRGFSGFLVQAHGGGLLAYFGYPQASENAARRAVQAALALCKTAFQGLDLRVGIHTGIVISGNTQMPDAIGATSGLAVRLRQVAECGEIVVSETTYPLISGYFECVDLGARLLRGLPRPVGVYKIVAESAARNRLEARLHLTPLVGRERELQKLMTAWSQASSGQPRTILVQGEAGIGKTRLLHAFKELLTPRGLLIRELRCASEYAQTPFQPMAELFAQILDFRSEDTQEVRFEKLVSYVGKHYPKPTSLAVGLIARILDMSPGKGLLSPDLPPRKLREMTFSLLLKRQFALARQQPFLLIIEDVHWADPSTLDLLKLLVTKKQSLPILSILTARPGFELGWEDPTVTCVALDALDDGEMSKLVTSIGAGLDRASVKRIVSRADGNPLFAEELVHALAGDLQTQIPATLIDLLAARLDAIGPARMMVQMAASIGREFSLDVLQQITALDAAAIAEFLEPLTQSGLLQRTEGGYQFRHALIRDAAYLSQARSERLAMHRRIATALVGMTVPAPAEVIARHWGEAGELVLAVRSWIKAGQQAMAKSACSEALSHFEAGLAHTEFLPAGDERLELELELQIGLGTASSAVQGYATTSGADYYRGVLALDRPEDRSPKVFQALWRLWAGASSNGGYSRALELAGVLLHRAMEEESDKTPAKGARLSTGVHFQQGQFAMANTLFWQGDFVGAQAYLQRLESAYRPQDHSQHISGFGEDAGVTGASYHSWVLWFLGFPDQAFGKSRSAVERARKLKHPFTLGYALTFAVLLLCRMGQTEEALVLSRELLQLARRHHFPLWEIGGELGQGWAMALQGRPESIVVLERCVEATRMAMGGVTLVVLAPLVEARLRLRHYPEALDLAREAQEVSQSLGDGHVMAELLRLEGESLLGIDPSQRDRAESLFLKSLEQARRQQARLFELRAAQSLAALWKDEGRILQSRTLLEDIVHGFSEGFGMPELRSSRVLLDSLSKV